MPAVRTQMIKPGERATQKPSVFGVALQPQEQQVTDLPESTGRGTSGAIRLDTVPGKKPIAFPELCDEDAYLNCQ